MVLAWLVCLDRKELAMDKNYAELQVTTNFSFLHGGAHPEELVRRAAELGYAKIAITDHNSLAGIVRAHQAAKAEGIRIIPACRLVISDGWDLLAYPRDKEAYGRLCALLSRGNLRAEKGECLLYRSDIMEFREGMLFVLLPPNHLNVDFRLSASYIRELEFYYQQGMDNLYLGVRRTFQANDAKIIHHLSVLSERFSIPMVALGDVYYHIPQRRALQDVLTCIREKCTIHEAGARLHQHAHRYLKPKEEIYRLFQAYPQALVNAERLSESCHFSLDQLEYTYPEEVVHPGESPQETLSKTVWESAFSRYGDPVPDKLASLLRHELKVIEELDYAPYFLTVYDIVQYARSQGILCQGRGSAANSAVCYVLGITSVSPTRFDLLFERFISSARNEPPDIDVDFEHERREEVIQYLYRKYGRQRCAIVATVTQFQRKGALRDVGKAMGLSLDVIQKLSQYHWELTEEWMEGGKVSSHGFDARDPHLRRVLELSRELMGFPRQLGQHTGGFVITRQQITELCPIANARMENRTTIEWNKEDIRALDILKIDLLALGMLTCIRKAFDLLREHYGIDMDLSRVPEEDPRVYERISQADTLGVFQVESRAQQSMLPRMKPRCFYDLVIQVALVRPGPIQGDMVHPYLRRRNGEEPVEYPSKELEAILRRTLGVPLFQEQAMKIAMVAAGFSAEEADELRRSMGTFKSQGKLSDLETKLIQGMVSRGYSLSFAQRLFRQLEGFGSYGFPESHAASFASLVYVSAWIKTYYPEVFAASLLNSMPLGFYRPAQIVIDAREHGVEVRPVDVNASGWDHSLEERSGEYFALRLGFRQIKGCQEEEIRALVAGRRDKPYQYVWEIRQAGVSLAELERLAQADAFRSMGMDRRQAIWEIMALSDAPQGVFQGSRPCLVSEPSPGLPVPSLGENMVADYSSLSLSLKAHPLGLLRSRLNQRDICPASDLSRLENGESARVAGLVLVRQRPRTASGVCFVSLEDETGMINLVIFESIFNRYRKEIIGAVVLEAEGKIQIEKGVVHLIVRSCRNQSAWLSGFWDSSSAGQDASEVGSMENPIQGELFARGRNFR